LDFTVIDVLNTPGAREYMSEKYGIKRVPMLAKGKEFAFGQMLDPYAKMIGVDPKTSERLSPEQLYKKQQMIFEAAQRYMRQFPSDRFLEKVIPNRDRVIRTLCYHIFRIGEAFLEAWNGAEYATGIADGNPPDSARTGDDVAKYGESIKKRYQDWWANLEDRKLSRVVKTYFGDVEAHLLYERVTWHSAQHARQLVAVLERIGIEPDRPLTAEDLKGLPLPDRLFE
jgi:hypothetical protein